MEDLGKSLSSVEHIIAIAGARSSSEPEKRGRNTRDFDINQPAAENKEDDEIPEGGADDYAEEGENENTRRKRLRLSKEQTKLLEESFRVNKNIRHWDKEELAVKAKLKPRQVEVWFQNRRVSFRTRQMESERAHLKQRCGPLMEENLKLQHEVEELRALIAASPTSILTLCPSCESATPSAGTQQCSASTPNTALGLRLPTLYEVGELSFDLPGNGQDRFLTRTNTEGADEAGWDTSMVLD